MVRESQNVTLSEQMKKAKKAALRTRPIERAPCEGDTPQSAEKHGTMHAMREEIETMGMLMFSLALMFVLQDVAKQQEGASAQDQIKEVYRAFGNRDESTPAGQCRDHQEGQ
jgi:hypothetical protein